MTGEENRHDTPINNVKDCPPRSHLGSLQPFAHKEDRLSHIVFLSTGKFSLDANRLYFENHTLS